VTTRKAARSLRRYVGRASRAALLINYTTPWDTIMAWRSGDNSWFFIGGRPSSIAAESKAGGDLKHIRLAVPTVDSATPARTRVRSTGG